MVWYDKISTTKLVVNVLSIQAPVWRLAHRRCRCRPWNGRRSPWQAAANTRTPKWSTPKLLSQSSSPVFDCVRTSSDICHNGHILIYSLDIRWLGQNVFYDKSFVSWSSPRRRRRRSGFTSAGRCSHLTITLIIQYTLISNYDVNCDFRFREVLLGNHKSYLDVAKIYQVVI